METFKLPEVLVLCILKNVIRKNQNIIVFINLKPVPGKLLCIFAKIKIKIKIKIKRQIDTHV